MSTISCSVESCYYNAEGICGAHILNIGGKNSVITEETCCETYIKRSYDDSLSNSAENRGSASHTDAVLCKVNTCAYHAKDHCMLGDIEVGTLKDAQTSEDTDCLSFERK